MRYQIASAMLLAAALFAAQPAFAGAVTISVLDSNGKPLANAVVALVANGNADQSAAPALPADAVIDQNHEMFNPLVTVIRRGGRVVFTNSDVTMHQVYSFSPLKRFEYQVERAQKTAPISFDQAGIVAVGCNIHDQMITYVYVTDNRWTARTGADGRASFANVPPGAYRADAWHPALPPRGDKPTLALNVGDAATNNTMALAVTPAPAAMPGMNMHSHKQDY